CRCSVRRSVVGRGCGGGGGGQGGGEVWGGGGGGGGGGVGGGGGGGGGSPVGSVTAGPGIEFVSGHNGSSNAAVDTIAIGGTVTRTWTGSLPDSVQSRGRPRFRRRRSIA